MNSDDRIPAAPIIQPSVAAKGCRKAYRSFKQIAKKLAEDAFAPPVTFECTRFAVSSLRVKKRINLFFNPTRYLSLDRELYGSDLMPCPRS